MPAVLEVIFETHLRGTDDQENETTAICDERSVDVKEVWSSEIDAVKSQSPSIRAKATLAMP
jgi:hypothetical protein